MESRKKTSFSTILKRILAGFLAVIIGISTILYAETSVRYPGGWSDRAQLLAGAQLLQSDEYMSMSRAGRMTSYMKYFLTLAKDYEDYELGASIAISRGNYTDAVACLEKALEKCQEENRAPEPLYYRISYLYVLTGEDDKALEWLNKGLESRPGAEGYLLRAQLLANRGEYEDAMADIRRFEARNGKTPEYAAYPAGIYEKAGQYETAEAYYDLALTAETPDPGYYLSRAHCRMETGNMKGAEEDCDAYLAAGGTDRKTAEELLGIGYMRLGDNAAAAGHFANVAAENDDAGESDLYCAAMTAFVSEDYAAAAEYGEKAIRKGAGGLSNAQLGLDSSGTLEIHADAGEMTDLYRITAVSETHTGEYEQAEKNFTLCLKEMESGSAEEGNLLYLRAVCEMALGKFSQAIRDLDQAIADGTERYGCLYSKGVCLYSTGDLAGAEECLREVAFGGSDEALIRNAKTLLTEIQRINDKGEQQK